MPSRALPTRDRFGWKQAALARNGACRGGWLRCLLALALPNGPRQSREQSSSVWSRGDRTCTHNVTWTARAERTESCFQSLRWLCNDWCYAHIPPIASPSTLVAVQYRTVLTNFSLIRGCVSSNCIQFSSLFAMNASRESHHTSCSTLNSVPKLVDDLLELLSRDMMCWFDDKRHVLERLLSHSTYVI